MSTLWDHNDVEVSSLEISVPEWIDPDIHCGTVAAILQGGCSSGAYMPAVTYWQAIETMSKHGDDVLDYIVESYGELIAPDDSESWSGMACHYLSAAVELWASGVESEIEDAISEREDRLVEWSLSDDGTMDTVISVNCRWCGESFDVRYDCEMAADYRDESGALDCEAFQDDVIYAEDHMGSHCGEYA